MQYMVYSVAMCTKVRSTRKYSVCHASSSKLCTDGRQQHLGVFANYPGHVLEEKKTPESGADFAESMVFLHPSIIVLLILLILPINQGDRFRLSREYLKLFSEYERKIDYRGV